MKEFFFLKLDSIIGYKTTNLWSYEMRFLFNSSMDCCCANETLNPHKIFATRDCNGILNEKKTNKKGFDKKGLKFALNFYEQSKVNKP